MRPSPNKVGGQAFEGFRVRSCILYYGPSGFPVGTPKMLCLTPWKSTESAYGSSHGHLTTVLAAVKGSLAWLGGFAALDACCAPWCTAAMR